MIRARELADSALVESLPRRWRHVQGVVEQARNLHRLAGHDADLLEAAAFVHDIGYAPELIDTCFHPIDGAIYLAEVGMPERLVNLVAHHSCAVLEAELRGLSAELEPFDDERGLIRDALWYCDQTTGPGGERVSARERHAEIKQRYGSGHLVTEFIEQGAPELLAAVNRTEQRLAALDGAG